MKKGKILKRIFGDPQAKALRRMKLLVREINSLEEKYQAFSDKELQKQTEILKAELSVQKSLDKILPDAFALVREASQRVLGMRHFDVQLMGGAALHTGNVAEMKTGEGKTLVATLPVYLNALEGKGVHVVTVNDYLAKRDAGWMGKLYDFLGVSVAVIVADESFIYDRNYSNDNFTDERMKPLRPCTRKEAYDAYITYGTNNEFGFDYLRDNMVNDAKLLRQRDLNYAIVDEVDSILIDEARTPLIISAPAADNPESYKQFARVMTQLNKDDYEIDEKHRSVALTDAGIEKVQDILGVDNLFSPEHVRLVYHLNQALRAQTLFKRDKDYVVTTNGEVVIVDEHTGRLMDGRRYNEGLHQAIEAKENVPVLEESMTLATISFQNYFRLYKKLSGMTGTALTEAEEFQQIYSLDVIEIPSNKPMIRNDKPDLIYKTERAKILAVVEAIKEHHAAGRPVLVGSGSIEKNELIAQYLDQAGLTYELLNAKNNEREAAIVEKAGEKGAITLATNIAGRGTDIKLGKGVKELGGLVVIGSERHESRRIDNQLRGRGGRQGDPGESQFFVSTEDDLMRIFQGEKIASLMDRLKLDESIPINNAVISKLLESSQKRVEGFNFDTRKNVVQYDNVINRHRKVVYGMRRKILEGSDIKDEIKRLIKEKTNDLAFLPAKINPNFSENFIQILPKVSEEEIDRIGKIKKDKDRLKVTKEVLMATYQEKEAEFTADLMRKIEREVYMRVLDTLWMQHLENMQHLREGIHWRSIGQRDPLVEYRSESQKLFEALQLSLRDEVLQTIFNLTKSQLNPSLVDENYQTELTKAAETAVEKGVNEISSHDGTGDDDFRKAKVASKAQITKAKDSERKKKKVIRQNRKKGRRK
ncbi:MAG: preprotein translocase subunit SecA [Candidatus Saccharibacteria bacterium]|nr:preprotein translocase subunit SecA [Candidatus Saccharibacteria bacterium]